MHKFQVGDKVLIQDSGFIILATIIECLSYNNFSTRPNKYNMDYHYGNTKEITLGIRITGWQDEEMRLATEIDEALYL